MKEADDPTTQCPLCDRAGVPLRGAGPDTLRCECPACGTFLITADGGSVVREPPRRGQRHLLSAMTRRASDADRPLRLTGSSVPDLLRSAAAPQTPYDVLDPLLMAIHDGLADVTGHMRLAYTDYPLFALRDTSSLREYLDLLQNGRMIEFVDDARAGSFKCRLRLPGWDRLARLRRNGQPSAQALVAMAFTPALAPAFDEGIRPALTETGWTPVRPDGPEPADRVDDRVVAAIHRCGLLVADLTGQHPGIYFTAGLALGLGLPVIWTVRHDGLPDLRLDIRRYAVVEWTTPEELHRRLVDRVMATVGSPGAHAAHAL